MGIKYSLYKLHFFVSKLVGNTISLIKYRPFLLMLVRVEMEETDYGKDPAVCAAESTGLSGIPY